MGRKSHDTVSLTLGCAVRYIYKVNLRSWAVVIKDEFVRSLSGDGVLKILIIYYTHPKNL
jgi:hypothetical protein